MTALITAAYSMEKLRGCVQAFRSCRPSVRSHDCCQLSATSTACTTNFSWLISRSVRPKRWARRIRLPFSATERREDERGHRRPVGRPGGDQELGEDAGARWVTFAWRLAPWMFSVFLCGPNCLRHSMLRLCLNWEWGCIHTIGSGIDHVISVVGTGNRDASSHAGSGIDHVISVVGWGNDAAQGQCWIVRKWARQWIFQWSQRHGAQPVD